MSDIIQLVADNRDVIVKLLVACALGGLIGLEREWRSKPAGFRTNILICLGAALLTEVSQVVAANTAPAGDPGRIAAQIVSGIGFLGAGTILQTRGNVTGLTTAATLWVVAAIGIAVGAGAYLHAVGSTALVMITLAVLGRLDDRLPLHAAPERTLRVTMEPRQELVFAIEQRLKAAGFRARTVDVDLAAEALVASFATRAPGADYNHALQVALGSEGVRRVTLLD